MSISRLSLNFCFWRLLMMENAMAMVSSCMRRFVSTSGISSPLMRSTGCEPTFRWRSDAFRSDAIFSRSLMCMHALPLNRRSTCASRRRLRAPASRDEREPAELVGDPALDHVEERPLQGLGDGTARPAADHDLVDGADRRDLGRRAGEEDLVGDVQHLARHALLDDRDPEPPREGDHAVARDAGQHRGDERRRDQGCRSSRGRGSRRCPRRRSPSVSRAMPSA